METVADFIFLGFKITANGDCSHEIKIHLLLGRKVMTNLGSILKSRDITLSTKVCLVKAMVLPGVMYGCENWTIKSAGCRRIWCFWTVVLEKTLENPLDCKEIQPVRPEGNQSWIFIGRTGAEAETPIFWPPDAKNWLLGKDPDDGKDWKQEEKRMTEDEMVWWYHWVDGHEFEQAPGVGDGQGSLVCCSPWGYQQSDMTEWLNWQKDGKADWTLVDKQTVKWKIMRESWVIAVLPEQSRVSQYPVSDKLSSIKIRVKAVHVPLLGLTPWGNGIIMRNLQASEVSSKSREIHMKPC